MKMKLDRVISIATLVALVVAIVVLLKRPSPLPPTQLSAAAANSGQMSNNNSSLNANTNSNINSNYSPTTQRLDDPQTAMKSAPSQAAPLANDSSAAALAALAPAANQSLKAEPHVDGNAINAAISGLLGAASGGAGSAALSPETEMGSGSPNIKDQKVDYDGDMVHGQFLTEIGGKDVWVTISGKMGQKDGYATFDPTEFKVGDVNVPVALVNPALQSKLAEQRDRLKIADPSAK